MNKIARHSFIILILIVTFLIFSYIVYGACCYFVGQFRCDWSYTGTQEQCESAPGNIYNERCENIESCETVCCCDGLITHYELRGYCEARNLDWIRTTEEGCGIHCSGEYPACKENCELNTEDCVGIGGLLPGAGKYYCSEDGSLHDLKSNCLDCMVVVEITDCVRDQQINETCICDEITYYGTVEDPAGYCCLDGRYVPDDGSKCVQVGKTCIEIGYECADACDPSMGTNPSFNYNPADPGNTNLCPENFPSCCEEKAPDYKKCCDQYELCTGIILPYNYASCNPMPTSIEKPCSEECERLDCVKGNWRINGGANEHDVLTHCYCDESYYNIYTDTSYCCDDGPNGIYQVYTCITETGNVSGSVYNTTDTTSSKWIANAEVDAYRFGTRIKNTLTNESGDYILRDLPYGDYRIYADKKGFNLNYIDVGLTISKLFNQNIGLTPYVEGPCDSYNPPAPDIAANHVKGKALVNLTWNISCDNVNEFIINRTPEHPLGEIKTDNFSFVDEDVAWGTLYTYSIRAHYRTNALSEWRHVQISLGSKLCEGIFNGEEFCLNESLEKGPVNIYRYECDENNARVNILPSGMSCIDENSNYVCAGPDENNETKCVYNPNCKEVEPFKPFGLYYTGASCLDNGDNWCYYDYSSTTIDKCDNCEGKTCYDYKSRDACLEDNCEASSVYVNREEGYNSGCEWIDLWEEFGKGICYDPDFEGEKCSLCNNEGGIFYNTGCSREVCSALGNCYSNTTDCFACSDEWGSRTTCETYKTEEACIGANGQEIDFENNGCETNVPVKIISSNDVCNLGVCKWDNSIGCYKDADDDDSVDCTTDICRKNLNPPITTPERYIPNMNASGRSIAFIASDEFGGAEKFYYCVDNANNCCPTNQENFIGCSQEYCWVLINPVDHLTDYVGAGIYYIRYYSIDDNDNVEQVKSLAVYIDKTPPPLSLTYITENQTETLSNLTIELESKEFISCSYSISPFVEADEDEDEFIEGRINKTFRVVFENLEDRPYTFTTICKDDVGNTNTTDWNILVDAVQQIRNPHPNSITLNKISVQLYVETSDASECIAKGSSGEIPLEQTPIDEHNFTHTYSGIFNNGTYHFEVRCNPVLGVKPPDDSFISFTVDKIAPITTAKKGENEFNFTAWYRTPLTIKLECNDIEQGNQPGEFGCSGDNIRYCLSSSPCIPVYNPESPSTVNVVGDNSLYFNYYSIDDGGTIEGIKNKVINIDNDDPTLEAISLTDPILHITLGYIVNISSVVIKGSYSDVKSGIKEIIIYVIEDQTSDFRHYVATLAPSGHQFSKKIELYNGTNTILLAPVDNAGNRKDYDLSVFYDIYGPLIVAGIFDHEGWKIDNNFERYAEYGQSINFSALITDIAGVDRSEITVECNQLSTPSCASYTTQTFNLKENGDYYSKIISDILPEGNYTVTFKAWDNFDNYNETSLWFLVQDTSLITLQLDISDGITAYLPDLTLTGTTESGIFVEAYLCDEDCWNCGDVVASDVGGPVSNPKDTFEDMLISDLIYAGHYPAEGDSYLIWKGILGDYFGEHDFLKFSDHDTFYEVTKIYAPQSGATKFDISPPMQKNIISSLVTVSAYESDKPTGWFELQDIVLNEGDNCIKVSGTRTETGKTAEDIFKHITYISSGLNITQKSPEFGEIVDSSTFQQSITMEVTTDFPAFCNITNEQGNKVAKQFNYAMDSSPDKKTHSKTIDQNDCTDNGGPFCYINNDDLTQNGVYHRYTVKCSPDGVVMSSYPKPICFGVRTWYKMGLVEYGKNICDGSTGCSGEFPQACQGVCIPNCLGRVCGPDPVCSQSCGSCDEGETCQNGQCMPAEGGPGGEHD